MKAATKGDEATVTKHPPERTRQSIRGLVATMAAKHPPGIRKCLVLTDFVFYETDDFLVKPNNLLPLLILHYLFNKMWFAHFP